MRKHVIVAAIEPITSQSISYEFIQNLLVFETNILLLVKNMLALWSFVDSLQTQVLKYELSPFQKAYNDSPTDLGQRRVLGVLCEGGKLGHEADKNLLIVQESFALIGIRIQDLIQSSFENLINLPQDQLYFGLDLLNRRLKSFFLDGFVDLVGKLPNLVDSFAVAVDGLGESGRA